MFKCLLIDDLPDSCVNIVDALSGICEFDIIEDPMDSLSIEGLEKYDSFLVDINMPGITGDQLIEKLRKKISHPSSFCLITNADFDASIMRYHNYLVDEFLSKNSSKPEIRSRFEVALARAKQSARKFKKGPIEVNLNQARVTIGGLNVDFTSTEYRIICNLLSNLANFDYVPKDVLIEGIWGDTFVENNTFSTHISNLNKKLNNYNIKIKTKRLRGLFLSF